MLEEIQIPGLDELTGLKAGKTVALSGVNATLAAVIACGAARAGKKTLLVMENDLKAARAADDVRQMTGDDGAFLPGGEIDLTRAVGSQESSWRRLEALTAVTAGDVRVLCTGAEAMALRMARPEPFRKACMTLKAGDMIAPSALCARLARMGYDRVGMVEGKGQFALRGSILDVYPPALSQGLRIEFFDDEIDSVREFDAISQRSLGDTAEARIAPACETLLADAEYAAAAGRMRKVLDADASQRPAVTESLLDSLPPLPDDEDDAELFDSRLAPAVREKNYREAENSEKARRMERLVNDADQLEGGIPFRRMRAWISVLTEKTGSVCDWFEPDLVLLCEPDRLRTRVEERLQGFAQDLTSAMERGEAVREQETLMTDWDRILKETGTRPVALLTEMLLSLGGIKPERVITLDAAGVPGYGGQIRLLRNDLAKWREAGYRIYLLSGGSSRGKRLQESLAELGEKAVFSEEGRRAAPGEAVILPITLRSGFVLRDGGTVVVSDADIWGEGYRKSKSRKHSGERISTFTDLKVGDYVVHEDHGVGIYQGTTRIQSEGTWRDYLLIQYAGSDKLYVPVEQLERVQRYIGNPNQPPKLNQLGGREWERQKGKVKDSLKELAFDLKELYAERSRNTGYAFSPDTEWQREFEDEFPWELTADQASSVREIKEDMESDRNMDRLLCGDVGYGKTEVSLRAAFKAIADNKQVALLAPTTILVQQHYNTIVKRFRHTGARVDFLSRFRTPKQQREVLEKLAAGDIDILVGTHRMLAKDVKFKNLGLLIVDEEQRFGVAHKEVIKNMKRQVDVLTLSATPIPRTLHMSMTGIRDMSVLETPPEERIPVQTVVTEYSDALIRDAILRELGRGGQVYFLYNRVRSIEKFHERLRALVPEARIGIAHGQMREHQLEDVMMDFYSGSYDVLLCTTIIENGLDIPSANTLIVYDAERFGLSQLYQLRGRVGRSNRQAYAYFTVRMDKILSETAQQRLTAIREFTEFGAGFRIAMRDLEIRGAGNILGPEQHGHLATVGYDMYCRLMEETLAEVQGKRVTRELETRVDLQVDAFLPGEYVSEEKQRMEMYKRIASITTDEERVDVTDELIDRYGEMPAVVNTLLDVSQLRGLCNRMGISQISRGKGGVMMKLDERYIPNPALFLQAIAETDGRLGLTARPPVSLMLRDPLLKDRDVLAESLKVMRKLNARMEKLNEEKTAAADGGVQ
ncbi:MAG: transcription-repair coupling factor [Clostridia bacterium]|nr:transcription-repair coupling factor [Clostridia bacterium]